MTDNVKKYFPQMYGSNKVGNSINTFDKMQAEMINIFGVPMDYYPVEVDIKKDIVFGEDTTKRYMRKHIIKGKIDNDGFDETLLYSGFGELNQIEFKIYLHLPTFLNLVGREPMAGDQFYLPFNSTFVYEVSHAVHAALGREGNVFGHKSIFVINCRERVVSNVSAGYFERYGVTDSQGNLRSDAPLDALVNDGTGRVSSKYDVKGPKVSDKIMIDNEEIKKAVDGENGNVGIAVQKSKNVSERWGQW